MKYLKIQNFLWIFLVVSLAVWTAVLFFSNGSIGISWQAFKSLPSVITIDLILWSIFVRWGWKLKILQGWLVPFPNLNGTWKGKVNSTWIDPTTEQSSPIDAFLVIEQSFLTVSCTLYTKEMVSHSYAAEFIFDQDNSNVCLIFSYHSVPSAIVRDRSAVHYGTTLLQVSNKPHRILQGNYWTDRKSTGSLEFKFLSDALLDSYPNK